MRVAFVGVETFHHHETDFTARMRRLAELLAERGHEVTIFCAGWWEVGPTEFDDGDLTYHAVTDDLSTPSWRFAVGLSGAIQSFDPDVIHATDTDPSIVLGAKLASLRLRAPFLTDWYDLEHSTDGYRRRRLAVRLPDLVVTPSRMVRTSVHELGRSVGSVATIPNSIDMDAIRTAEPEPLADIVYSHALDETANLESLLLALAEFRSLGWTAAVIGDGSARDDYERQARDLRINDRVEFVGGQPLDRRLSIFKGAHVYVQTARYAPFATDFLRALACGCVGIAEYHAASSAHELIEQCERGFRTTSDEEIVDAIRAAADLSRMDVNEEFSGFDESTILDRYLDCYRDLREAYDLF